MNTNRIPLATPRGITFDQLERTPRKPLRGESYIHGYDGRIVLYANSYTAPVSDLFDGKRWIVRREHLPEELP